MLPSGPFQGHPLYKSCSVSLFCIDMILLLLLLLLVIVAESTTTIIIIITNYDIGEEREAAATRM